MLLPRNEPHKPCPSHQPCTSSETVYRNVLDIPSGALLCFGDSRGSPGPPAAFYQVSALQLLVEGGGDVYICPNHHCTLSACGQMCTSVASSWLRAPSTETREGDPKESRPFLLLSIVDISSCSYNVLYKRVERAMGTKDP